MKGDSSQGDVRTGEGVLLQATHQPQARTHEWQVTNLIKSLLLCVVCPCLALGCTKVAACSAEVKQEVASPRGKWKAVVFDRTCGVLSSPQTGVSVLEPSLLPGDEYPNVFDVTYTGIRRPDEIEAILANVSVEWTSDSSLSIAFDARARILYQVTRLWGLSVTYRQTAF